MRNHRPVSPFPLTAQDQEKFAQHVESTDNYIRQQRPFAFDVAFHESDSADLVEAIRYHYNQRGWCVMHQRIEDGNRKLFFQ